MTKEEFIQVINTIASQYENQLSQTNANLYRWQYQAVQNRKGLPTVGTPEYQEYVNDMMQYEINSNMLRLVRDYVSLPALKRIEHMSEVEMEEYRQAKLAELPEGERRDFAAKTDEEIKNEIIESRGLTALKSKIDDRYHNDEDQYFVTIAQDPMKRSEYINLGLRTWNLSQQVVYDSVNIPYSVNLDFAKEVLGDIGFKDRTRRYSSTTISAQFYANSFGKSEQDLVALNYDLEKIQKYHTHLSDLSRKLDTTFSFGRLHQFLPGEVHGYDSVHGADIDWDLMQDYANNYFSYKEHFVGQDPEEIRMRVSNFRKMAARLAELSSRSFKTKETREEIEELTARVGAFQDDFYSTVRGSLTHQMREQLALGRRDVNKLELNQMMPGELQSMLEESKQLIEKRAEMLTTMEFEFNRTKSSMISSLDSRNANVVSCHQQFRRLVGIEDPNKFVHFALPDVEQLNQRMFAAVLRNERENVIDRVDTLAQEQADTYEQQLQSMTPEQLIDLRERMSAEGLIDSQTVEEPTIGGVKR